MRGCGVDLVATRDYDGLRADDRYRPYVARMRDQRELLELVDRVGSYGSAWWLDASYGV